MKSTLSVPRGYSYSPGSFSKLMSKNFMDVLQVNARYAHDNQKAFKANWKKICKDYKVDQKRMAEAIQKEANQHKGFWEVVFGVGAVVIGVAAIVATFGAATPLVAVAWTAGAYGLSNVFEGSQIMVTGADKAFNPLRDTLFQGNQSAYDTFGNVAVFMAGTVIPVGDALKAGQPVSRAFIGGVGRTSVTTAVGVGTNFVVAPIATSLVKSLGIDPIWAKDIGIATSIFAAGKAYKGSGNGGKGEAFDGGIKTPNYVKLSKELGKKVGNEGYKIIDIEDAMQANEDWADMGYNLPPVAENTKVYNVEAGDFRYARVFKEGVNNPKSPFILRADDIKGLSASEIAEKYALPQVPDRVVYPHIPSDTPLEASIVGPQKSWGTIGGDAQYAIKDALLDDDWFTDIHPLD